jgi:hypothetical protein
MNVEVDREVWPDELTRAAESCRMRIEELLTARITA